jgi:YceI-like domain
MKTLLFFLLLMPFMGSSPQKYTYSVQPTSCLNLFGSSNVNKFECTYSERFTQGSVQVAKKSDCEIFKVSGGVLYLKSAKLDCHHKIMNNDLQEALQADEYPHIRLEVLEIGESTSSYALTHCEEWTKIPVTVEIRIVKSTQQIHTSVQIKKLGENRYRLIFDQNLRMSDFDITPPTAMMGMIKVSDHIRIHLDWVMDITAA